MYPVSQPYLDAMKARHRVNRMTGLIRLVKPIDEEEPPEPIVLSDEIILGDVAISQRVCGSKMEIGTFYTSELTITIKDDEAYDREYAGALIIPYYEIKIDEHDNWERVPLGKFYVDGQRCNRNRNRITLKAYDSSSKFDIALPKLVDGNKPITKMYPALVLICNTCGITFGMNSDEFGYLPNSTIEPYFDASRIKTCRDMIIWIALLTNSYATIDRYGRLAFRQYYYDGGDDYVRMYDADERESIKFTDTRTYVSRLNGYCLGKPKFYSRNIKWEGTGGDHYRNGAINIPKNPLIDKLDEYTQDDVNMSYLSSGCHPTRYIKMKGWVDPALDLLDVCAFRGGTVDIGKIQAPCTAIEWRYRGIGTITCQNFDEYSEPVSESDEMTISLLAVSDDPQPKEVIPYIPVKSQGEKRIDDMDAQLVDGWFKHLRTDDGYAWVDTTYEGVDFIHTVTLTDPTGKPYKQDVGARYTLGKRDTYITLDGGTIKCSNTPVYSYETDLPTETGRQLTLNANVDGSSYFNAVTKTDTGLEANLDMGAGAIGIHAQTRDSNKINSLDIIVGGNSGLNIHMNDSALVVSGGSGETQYSLVLDKDGLIINGQKI